MEEDIEVIVIHFHLKCSIGWNNSKNNVSGVVNNKNKIQQLGRFTFLSVPLCICYLLK